MNKAISILLAGSLALNGAIGLLLWQGNRAESEKDTRPVAADNRAPAARAPAIDAEAWSKLETPDLRDLAARLRDAGFPIEVIRAILTAQLTETFAARRKALDPDAASRPFWKNRPATGQVDIALQQTWREQRKALRDILGADAEAEDAINLAFRGRRLDGLPPEKAQEVKSLLQEFEDQRQEIYMSGTANMDREKLTNLDKAQQAALARLLTPQELQEYNLRNSNTANYLKQELSAFNPTEEEFRAIFQLRHPFDEQFGLFNSGPPSPDQMRQRSEAQKLLTQQIMATLTPDRAAEYERATDYSYRQTSQLVARLELPPATSAEVYAVQKSIQDKIGSLYSDRSLSADARAQQFAALAEEAKTRITPLLGAQGFEAYKQYGGSWMQRLQPPSQPAGPGSGTVIRQISR